MNSLLLHRLTRELKDRLTGRVLGLPSWFPPVLAVPVDDGKEQLVCVLQSPGPFCFLTTEPPFAGAAAPPRFPRLAGAHVGDVSLEGGDRVLRVDATHRNEAKPLVVLVTLFGSAGRAVLMRGETVLESLGAPEREPAPGRSVPADATAGSGGPAETVDEGGPFVLVVRGRLGAAEPAPIGTSADASARVVGPFATAVDACACLGREILSAAHATILARSTRPLRRKADSLRRLAANLEADVVRAADHARERREAETLAAYQSRVPASATEVELPDVYDPTRTVCITLDPARPLHAQIEKRFRLATKLARSAVHAGRRLELVRRELAEIEAALVVLDRSPTLGEATRQLEALRGKFGLGKEATPSTSGPRKRARTEERTFRRYDLDAHWFVIVGRSNDENDEITFRRAAPTDLWFHAQGVSGSHVVLKNRGGNEQPSKRIIELAASIAGHFSKARHSTLVPVIYTQRKYVRKFRGAKAGQVTCERETMVMVSPELPAKRSG